MKSPDSCMSKASKRKFQEKRIRASRSANQSMKSPEPKPAPQPNAEEEEEDDDLMKDTEECPAEKMSARKPLDGSVGTMASLSMSLQSPDNITNN